ncbi:hypothetical protein ACA910_004653 [Epithemia clementina (nom. ined.)]
MLSTAAAVTTTARFAFRRGGCGTTTTTTAIVVRRSNPLFRSRRCPTHQYGRRVLSTAATTASGGGSGGSSSTSFLALLGVGALAGALYWKSSELEQQVSELQTSCQELQVQLAGKTNSAFLFIKPHACQNARTVDQVQAVVEDTLRAHGIRITGHGAMTAETIDANQHIDTHYGAIARKAVTLKPSELNVPEKGQADFQKLFGESWDEAIQAGKVYNAKDAAEQFHLTSAQINDFWSQLKPGQNLIKFGGGFYCGKLTVNKKQDIYVMNGFYMAMRAAYCNPGEKIVWYTVSWPSDALSWQDFRAQVLGSTNPAQAPKHSIRRQILDRYKELGLPGQPNTGDNGVHASASPLEGLAERVNWLGADIETDPFGKGLLAAGISKATIQEWSQDVQVTVDGETAPGKTMSVFDALEDLDADTTLAKVTKIQTATAS